MTNCCLLFANNMALNSLLCWYHHHHHHHHLRAAGEGRCVTPVPWPRRMADLHNVERMLPVSLWIWSTHLLFGRPERRFQSRPGRRPSDRSTWARRAWWAGTSSPSLAVWPKIAIRRLLCWYAVKKLLTHSQTTTLLDKPSSSNEMFLSIGNTIQYSQYRKSLHRDVASTVQIITVHKIINNSKQLLR